VNEGEKIKLIKKLCEEEFRLPNVFSTGRMVVSYILILVQFVLGERMVLKCRAAGFWVVLKK
jgi:hypothetical protein